MSPDIAHFEPHRPFLRGLAYRMLGSRADAEDVVQDAWLRWHKVDHQAIDNPRAFLARIVTRLCLDRMQAARVLRETYPGVWLPEPVIEDMAVFDPGPEVATELAQDLSYAFLVALERLSPLQRTAFLLHDVFDIGFAEIGHLTGRSEASCRQLASRGRKQIRSGHARFSVGAERRNQLTHAFAEAIWSGDATILARLLSEDCTLIADGGGKAAAVPRPLRGCDLVAKALIGFARTGQGQFHMRLGQVNGDAGLLVYDLGGQPIQTITFEYGDSDRITRIFVQRNPEKLSDIPALDGHAAGTGSDLLAKDN